MQYWLCFLQVHSHHAVPGIQHGVNDIQNFRDGTYRNEVEDMRVKVQGGYVRVTRTYAEERWQFNRRWADLESSATRKNAINYQLVRKGGTTYAGKLSGGYLFRLIDLDKSLIQRDSRHAFGE